MAAAATNVIPLRWTARGFMRAGVVFYREAGAFRVRGPEDRPDLRELLVEEVARRAEVFVKFAPLDRSIAFPRVHLPGVRPVRSDACDACGDSMDEGRGGMCALCTLALQRTLRQLGRIP